MIKRKFKNQKYQYIYMLIKAAVGDRPDAPYCTPPHTGANGNFTQIF